MNDDNKTCLVGGVSPYAGYTSIRFDGQQDSYLVLCQEERDKGFIRPVRREYLHA